MLRAVQANTFFPFCNSNLSGYQTSDAVANQCSCDGNNDCDANAGKLHQEKLCVAEEQTISLPDVIDGNFAE